MTNYRVESLQTNFLIGHTGFERPGAVVISNSGNPNIPLHHHLVFSETVSPDSVTIVTVKQWNGLYIGLDQDIGRLVWTSDAFEWQVAPTGPFYRFYPKDGDDLYWYQNQQIVPEVGAKAGKDLVAQEPLFVLQQVDN